MSFQNKYLKYKTKYMLSKQRGGVGGNITIVNIIDNTFTVLEPARLIDVRARVNDVLGILNRPDQAPFSDTSARILLYTELKDKLDRGDFKLSSELYNNFTYQLRYVLDPGPV